jgi:hypothetical protein
MVVRPSFDRIYRMTTQRRLNLMERAAASPPENVPEGFEAGLSTALEETQKRRRQLKQSKKIKPYTP